MSERPCLHLLMSSPRRSQGLTLCRRYLSAGDTLLLLQDGVNAVLLPAELKSVPRNVAIAALQADIQARGLRLDGSRVELIDDAGFVELVELHPICQTWV